MVLLLYTHNPVRKMRKIAVDYLFAPHSLVLDRLLEGFCLANGEVIYVDDSTGKLLPIRREGDRIATRIGNRAQPCGVGGVYFFIAQIFACR